MTLLMPELVATPIGSTISHTAIEAPLPSSEIVPILKVQGDVCVNHCDHLTEKE